MSEPRERVQYELDVDDVVATIQTMNSSPAIAAGDCIMHKAFPSLEVALSPDTMAERVVLLDGLWATNLRKDTGAADRIAVVLAESSQHLFEHLEGLQEDQLDADPEGVWEVAQEVFPLVLRQSFESTKGYWEHMSFAAKFFHWCTRRHFPIWDANARQRISQLQTSTLPTPSIKKIGPGKGKRLPEYKHWIEFYGDLVQGLGSDDRRRLEQVDCDTLPQPYRFRNSLLRILDKYFWWRGGNRSSMRRAARK